MSKPASKVTRALLLGGLLAAAVFGGLLTHDCLYGPRRAILPAPLSDYPFTLNGPPLLLVSAVLFLLQGIRGLRRTKPGEESSWLFAPSVMIWCVRILGLGLLAVPFIAVFLTYLRRPAGERLWNEGTGLGFFLLLMLFGPAGAAVTALGFCLKTRKPEPREGYEDEQ